VFKAVATVLRPGGHFVFTVEVLTPRMRWPMAIACMPADATAMADYVRTLLQAHGLAVVYQNDEVLREEVRQPWRACCSWRAGSEAARHGACSGGVPEHRFHLVAAGMGSTAP
jgi:hypothetical protein